MSLGLLEASSESQMQIHPLPESLVPDPEQTDPGSDPTGLHLEQTEQIDLSHLVLNCAELIRLEVVVD